MKRCISILVNILTLCLPLIFGKRRTSTFVKVKLKTKIKEENFMRVQNVKQFIQDEFPNEQVTVTIDPVTDDVISITLQGMTSHKVLTLTMVKKVKEEVTDGQEI